MIGELVVIALGSAFWAAIGYGVGFEHGEQEGRRSLWREVLADAQVQRETAAALTTALKCPVCGAGRSNTEVSQGWCANCGVYSSE